MNEILQDTIEKIAAAAEAEGIDLSAEELAGLAYEKLAEDSEESESEEEEKSESKEEEEKEEEAGEEEEKEGSLDEDALVEAYEASTKEAVDAVMNEAPDLDAEDTAKMASELVDDIFQVKVAELQKQAKKPPKAKKVHMPSIAKIKGRAKSLIGSAEKALANSPKFTRAGKAVGLAGAGVAGGYLAGRLLSQDKGKTKKGSIQDLYNRMQAKQAAGTYDEQVVKTAREFLVLSGFDPNTGKPLDKIALAKTPEEKVKVGALTMLEQNGWPIQWDPRYLARALEEG